MAAKQEIISSTYSKQIDSVYGANASIPFNPNDSRKVLVRKALDKYKGSTQNPEEKDKEFIKDLEDIMTLTPNDYQNDYQKVLALEALEKLNKISQKSEQVKEFINYLKARRITDLSEVKLPSADLTGADLSGFTLSGADLTGATLNNADLSGADLTKATLNNANLSGADLKEANLTGADLKEAKLMETCKGAKPMETCKDENKIPGANLTGATLNNADLSGADFSGANLSGTDLTCNDLTNRKANSNKNTTLTDGKKGPCP